MPLPSISEKEWINQLTQVDDESVGDHDNQAADSLK